PAIGRVRLIDPRTFEALATLTSPESSSSEPQRIIGLAFSPDGTYLAAACLTPRAVQLWDLRLIRQQLGARGLDWDLPPYLTSNENAPSPTPPVVRVDTEHRKEGWRKKHVLRGHKGAVRTVAFSPAGGRIISGGDDRTVRTWDAATGQ